MQIFQGAFEIALRTVAPQGMQFEALRDRMNGEMKAKGKRPEYGREEWARDFLNCLPDDPECQRLLMVHYLPVYVCGCNGLQFEAGRCDGCGEFRAAYRMNQVEAGRCGGTVKHFWQRVQDRRLFGVGLRMGGV